ncbi:MAG: response regulator transcription factor [Erysipelotrichaceae bacterium]|jgi:two-component system alkaline phosphatase synthesis response regulator PhoP|nr:response regulator transcription factor [Erysipelotrichaceae bacterium]
MMIYCVEDDSSIRELITYTLKVSGFESKGFENAEEFFAALEEKQPELVILDIMLEGKDGLTILRELREDKRYGDIPVIMATARTSEFDKVIGLDSGADDYLSKPFGMMEMVSRVKSVLRRSHREAPSNLIRFKQIEVDRSKHVVRVNDEQIVLTPKEYDLLLCLIENQGIVFSREQLLEKIWGLDYLGESRTIDVHINTLRNKLKEAGRYIVTMHGVGYYLKEENDG